MADFVLEGGISHSHYIEENVKSISPTKNSGVTGNLEYVKMLNNPRLTVKISVPPNGNVITSALSSDFGINLGNSWSPLVPLSSLPLIGDIGQGIMGIATATLGATQISLESLWMTSASWSGSKIPEFPVRLAFLNYTEQSDALYQMLAVAQGTLPPDLQYNPNVNGELAEDVTKAINSVQDSIASGATTVVGHIGGSLSGQEAETWLAESKLGQDLAGAFSHSSQWGVGAPCNYGLEVDRNEANAVYKPKGGTTFALKIGNWFEANNLLIDNLSITFSKEITPDGNPLLMYLDVRFRPYRNITFKEFLSYFKNVSSSAYESKVGGSSRIGNLINSSGNTKIGGNA